MSKLQEKTRDELTKEIIEKKEMIQKFRFDMAGSKIKNVKEAVSLKKDLARLMAEINRRK